MGTSAALSEACLAALASSDERSPDAVDAIPPALAKSLAQHLQRLRELFQPAHPEFDRLLADFALVNARRRQIGDLQHAWFARRLTEYCAEHALPVPECGPERVRLEAIVFALDTTKAAGTEDHLMRAELQLQQEYQRLFDLILQWDDRQQGDCC